VRAARRDLAQRVPLLRRRDGHEGGGVGHGLDGWISFSVLGFSGDGFASCVRAFLFRAETGEAETGEVLKGNFLDGIEGCGNGRRSECAWLWQKEDRRAPEATQLSEFPWITWPGPIRPSRGGCTTQALFQARLSNLQEDAHLISGGLYIHARAFYFSSPRFTWYSLS
jgi:hypothetical protein